MHGRRTSINLAGSSRRTVGSRLADSQLLPMVGRLADGQATELDITLLGQHYLGVVMGVVAEFCRAQMGSGPAAGELGTELAGEAGIIMMSCIRRSRGTLSAERRVYRSGDPLPTASSLLETSLKAYICSSVRFGIIEARRQDSLIRIPMHMQKGYSGKAKVRPQSLNFTDASSVAASGSKLPGEDSRADRGRGMEDYLDYQVGLCTKTASDRDDREALMQMVDGWITSGRIDAFQYALFLEGMDTGEALSGISGDSAGFTILRHRFGVSSEVAFGKLMGLRKLLEEAFGFDRCRYRRRRRRRTIDPNPLP